MSGAPQLPRSYLFVPADRPERLAKALASGADAVVLDLEDAVQPMAKIAARQSAAQALAALSADERQRVVLRVNDVATDWFADDLQLLAERQAPWVMLPKAESPDTVAALRRACPGLQVLALVETASGLQAAASLAAAPGVQRLVFGSIDYALDLDLAGDLSAAGGALDHAACHLAVVSRAAGIAAPVAGVTVALDDEAQLQADVARARAQGLTAKLCIHPRQVAVVHAALAPSAAESAWARRVLAAAEAAGAAGAVQLDGRMVDKPVIERARRLLARATD